MKLLRKIVYRIILIFLIDINNVAESQLQEYEGEILTGPHTQVVAPGETAYFVCHARGDSVYWYINNTDPHPQRYYEAMGFSFSYLEFPHAPHEPEEHNNTITVEARPSINGTVISCTAVGTFSNQHDFQEGTLIIAGPPCPPVVEFTQSHLVNGIIYSHLSWSAPFTFQGFPITNYSFTKFNHSNGDTITIVWIANNYSDGYRYSYQALSQGNHCYELDFTVVAANRLGSSQPAVVHTGHPIVPADIGNIDTVITFQNTTPHLWMRFSAPRICPYSYQTGSYNITIYNLMNQMVVHVGPTEYTHVNESEPPLEFRADLDSDEHYTVEVVVQTAGVVRVKRKDIDTFINELPHLTTDNGPINENLNTTLAKTTEEPSTTDSQELATSTNKELLEQHTSSDSALAAVAGGLGAIAFISCFMTSILLAVFVIKRQKRNNAHGETIDVLISPTSSTPDTPADVTPRYFRIECTLPPPRNGSVAMLPTLETVDAIKAAIKDSKLPHSGDEYVVKNGAQLDGKTDLHDADKSNAEEMYTMMK